MTSRLLAVLGPTATGKTGLAIELAERLGGEIISVDSRQAYTGLVVGTAAPGEHELARALHHGVDFLPPGARYGAGEFARRARGWIEEIRERGRLPILAGGTGLFYRALTRPMFREPSIDRARRTALEGWLEAQALQRLRGWVRVLDPALDDRLHVLDRQRCLRAIEIALLTGRPLSWWHRHGRPEADPVQAFAVVLTLPADEHRRRIRQRAKAALDGGWVDEVKWLHAAGHGRASPAFSSIGYTAVDGWISGEISRDEALTRIVRDTWAYARRQRTWFRHQLPRSVPRLDGRRPVAELADLTCEAWHAPTRDDNAEGDGTNG